MNADPAQLFDEMRKSANMLLADRTYRGTTYRDCFIASDAVEVMGYRWGLARAEAVRLGVAWQDAGLLHHVVRQHTFADEPLFFRFGAGPAQLAKLSPAQLLADMRGAQGVAIQDRRYLGRTYPACFIGREAVDWLRARHGLSVGEAESIGQRFLEKGRVRHVLDEHPFLDAGYFYRFREDE